MKSYTPGWVLLLGGLNLGTGCPFVLVFPLDKWWWLGVIPWLVCLGGVCVVLGAVQLFLRALHAFTETIDSGS
ncbi:hypothetical protein [Frigoriglobus tundricola]|uniref:Uncharacterized protein n=1 Tax=Frigoriglobus tundricola TaxID=2774151 RepID=A0A6M5YZR5_9BACT|nr:hypothetical protein [Frigoriglobus tundricola]QJW99549.1 hypothetical protein FTUN_7161 [Frigoriglobus tundricola]